MNKILRKILFRSMEFVTLFSALYTILFLGSNSVYDYTLLYAVSSTSLVFAFILAITEGLFLKYLNNVLGVLFLIIVGVVIDFHSCQLSITPILFIISATVSLLTFYYLEIDRKKGMALKKEVDDRPFIISKPSDFEINEEDFPVDESSKEE